MRREGITVFSAGRNNALMIGIMGLQGSGLAS
jgi:hypothetical protein